MRNGKTRFSIVTITLLASVTSCSFTKTKGTAESAVIEFHYQFNSGKFHEIYVNSDDALKKITTEEDFVALLEAVHRKLGNVKDSHPANWGVNATTGGMMATLGYDVEFTQGRATEQFVFHVSGQKASLYGYHIESPLLITK